MNHNVYILGAPGHIMFRKDFLAVFGICLLAFAAFGYSMSLITLSSAAPSNPTLGMGSGQGSSPSCTAGFTIVGTRSVLGNLGGGCACQSDSDCKSGECDCHTTGSQDRCCNAEKGESCTTHSDCQSNNCNPNTKKCVVRGDGNDSRPGGMACNVNEDCNSGYCDKDPNGNGWYCRN